MPISSSLLTAKYKKEKFHLKNRSLFFDIEVQTQELLINICHASQLYFWGSIVFVGLTKIFSTITYIIHNIHAQIAWLEFKIFTNHTSQYDLSKVIMNMF